MKIGHFGDCSKHSTCQKKIGDFIDALPAILMASTEESTAGAMCSEMCLMFSCCLCHTDNNIEVTQDENLGKCSRVTKPHKCRMCDNCSEAQETGG